MPRTAGRVHSDRSPAAARRRALAAAALAAAALSPAIALAQDTDGDGINDVADVYPCDLTASAVAYEPGEGVWGTILFEDQWPFQGDLDFNDTALAYNLVYARDAEGRTSRIQMRVHALAVGGMLDLGLGLHLPVPRGAVATVRRTVGTTVETLTPSATDSELTVVLSDNLRELFDDTAGQINVIPSVPTRTPRTLTIEIVLETPTVIAAATGPHDLFTFRTADPTHEIHRSEYGGTSRMRAALFGTGNDGSTSTRRFIDTDGLPFALVFPILVDFPEEGVDIAELWPHITAFASSAGATNRDFYQRDVVAAAGYGQAPAPPSIPARTSLFQEQGVCLDGVHTCTVGAGSGTQTWTGSGWTACAVTGCVAGYHAEGNTCASDVRTCAVQNGSGSQTWSGGAWGPCEVTGCSAGQLTPGGTACVVPRSCNDAHQRGFTASGLYTIDPDGEGTGLPAFGVYCDMSLDGGGWTLLFNRRAGNLSRESCGSNLTQFLHMGCGSPSLIGATDSYALTGAQRTAVPTTQVMVTQYLNGVLDTDDAYVVDLVTPNTDLFPDTNQAQNIALAGACNLAGTACDRADVYWKYIGDYWYHSSRCQSGSSGSSTYRGNYGLCAEGASNNGDNSASYPSSMTFGNRNEYQETKLWGHPNGAVDYQERVWARDNETCPSCAVSSCGGGNHLEGLSCVANTRTCSIPNGSGTQAWTPASWYSNGGGWAGCVPATCNSGYRMSNGACVQLTYAWSTGSWGACGGGTPAQSYSAWGSCGGGSGAWSYGAWGACSASAVCSGSGTQTRSATCDVAANSGSQARTGTCVWSASSGAQTRSASCVDNFGAAADPALCGAAPATSQACTPSGTPASCGSFTTVQACTPSGSSVCGTSVTSQACASPAGSQACGVPNGTGSQSCAAGANTWSSCTMTSCNSGYVASGGNCITDTGPASCLQLLNAGQTTSGLYTIDPDGVGGVAQMTVYCDMTTAGGGWTLIANRRAGTTNTESCGANVMQFFTNGCGTPSAIGASNSYAMTQAQRNAVPKSQVLVTQFLNGVLDSDDAYIVDLPSSSTDLFPNSNAVSNTALPRVCNISGGACDTTDVYWKYVGDYWYHSSMCWSGTSADATYRGNYGLCPSGAANNGAQSTYPSSGGYGNRSGYDETKLWAHPNNAAAYQERLWVR